MTHSLPFVRKRGFLLLSCWSLIIFADWLFYGQPLGWSVALLFGIATVAVTLRTPRLWKTNAGRIALTLSAFILLALVEEPTPLAILMSVLGLAMLVFVARGGWTTSIGEWILRLLQLLIPPPILIVCDYHLAGRWFRKHPSARPAHLRFILRWVLPLFAGGIFVILFIVANPIIEKWAHDAFTQLAHIFDWLPLFLAPSRILLWFFTGLCAYGLLRYRRRARQPKPQGGLIPSVVPPPGARPSTAHFLIIRCLIIFNLVFAVQTILDLIYLYGGAALPPGLTYAHYAHRGAYPLVATALLAGFFVLVSFRTHGPAYRSPLARHLVYLWLAQNILLLISTIWRLWMYVGVYSLSRLRLAAMIWILLVAAGFVWLIWKIIAGRTNAWLWRMNVVSLLAVLYLCAFINFPGLIADFNVRHCGEINAHSAPLDIAYLENLGPAALPALQWIHPRLSGAQQLSSAAVQHCLESSLSANLLDWRGWTFRRHRIAQQLDLSLAPSPDLPTVISKRSP